MTRKLTLALLFGLLLSTVAMADVDRQGWLVGAAYTRTSVEADTEDLDSSLTSGGDFSDSSQGWKIFGGYRFMNYFGVEGAWNDMGETEDSVFGNDVTLNVESYNFSAVGFLPVGAFDFFAKVGYHYWDAEATFNTGGSNQASGSENDWDFSYGIGAGVTIGDHFGIRLEYEEFNTSNINNMNQIAVSGLWQF